MYTHAQTPIFSHNASHIAGRNPQQQRAPLSALDFADNFRPARGSQYLFEQLKLEFGEGGGGRADGRHAEGGCRHPITMGYHFTSNLYRLLCDKKNVVLLG